MNDDEAPLELPPHSIGGPDMLPRPSFMDYAPGILALIVILLVAGIALRLGWSIAGG